MALLNISRIARNILCKPKIKQFRWISSSEEYPPDPDDHTKSYWHKDWLHGPYPRTKEERDAAAKKYNLLPEDYQPFPEEECFGDYPNLDLVCAAQKHPHEPYDTYYLKRNFGEPLHIHFDLYREDWLNDEDPFQTPMWKQVLTFVSMFSTIAGLLYLGEQFKIELPLIPKQYPNTGVIHYTFEPADADDS